VTDVCHFNTVYKFVKTGKNYCWLNTMSGVVSDVTRQMFYTMCTTTACHKYTSRENTKDTRGPFQRQM